MCWLIWNTRYEAASGSFSTSLAKTQTNYYEDSKTLTRLSWIIDLVIWAFKFYWLKKVLSLSLFQMILEVIHLTTVCVLGCLDHLLFVYLRRQHGPSFDFSLLQSACSNLRWGWSWILRRFALLLLLQSFCWRFLLDAIVICKECSATKITLRLPSKNFIRMANVRSERFLELTSSIMLQRRKRRM